MVRELEKYGNVMDFSFNFQKYQDSLMEGHVCSGRDWKECCFYRASVNTSKGELFSILSCK